MKDRANIEKAKALLPMTALLDRIAPDWRNKNPIRADDKHNSFGAGKHGWEDHGPGGAKGDQITFLEKFEGLRRGDAIRRFLELAGVETSHKNGHSPKPVELDWPTCVACLTDDKAQELAEYRGYSLAFVQWLKSRNLIGIYRDDRGKDQFALPLHDDRDDVVGVHHKHTDGKWRTLGATRPLIIGDRAAAKWLIFESQWDAFAVMESLDFHIDGYEPPCAILVTRGADNGKFTNIIPADSEAIIVMQNDEPKNGKIASDGWLETIKTDCPARLRVARPPLNVKDANDWLRRGDADFNGMLRDAESAGTVSDGITRKSLLELYQEPPNPEDNLLGNRWLCRGACALVIAPTGVGKSSSSAQMDVAWTAGKPAFGIMPAKPLRILTIQVENDAGDLHEMVHGIVNGMKLGESEIQALGSNNRIVTMPGKMGLPFIQALDKELAAFPCDILRVDPATGFFPDDVKDSKAVNQFCRQWLQPLIAKHHCGLILLLHTPKTNHRDTSDWKDHDWMYAGAGAADWSNFARAILIIEPKEYPVFEFKATKRKQRIGWVDANGQPISEQFWAHSMQPGSIFWEPATAEQQENSNATQKTKYTLLALVPDEGTVEKKALVSRASTAGIGAVKAKGFLAELIQDGILEDVAVPRKGTRPEAHVQRPRR